jgi:hypothetical protein
VQRHSHRERRDPLPRLRDQGSLGGQRRGERIRSRAESSAKLVPDRLENVTAVAHNGGAEQHVVAGKSGVHGFRVLLPEAGAALDVGE